MFSDRMEEQLLALQSWKSQIQNQETVDAIPEILDMLLKWLTWMMFSTNTQVWKAVLDVFQCLVDHLVEQEFQLTDREVQITLPNLLDKSGHSQAVIRDSLATLIESTLPLFLSYKVSPIVVQAMASKNKKSASFAVR